MERRAEVNSWALISFADKEAAKSMLKCGFHELILSNFRGVDSDSLGIGLSDGIVGRKKKGREILVQLCWHHGSPMARRRWLPVSKVLRSRRGCGLIHEYEYQLKKFQQQITAEVVVGQPAVELRLPVPAAPVEQEHERKKEIVIAENEDGKQSKQTIKQVTKHKAATLIQTVSRGHITRRQHTRRCDNPVSFAVVLGALGAGKTTMCRLLVAEYFRHDQRTVWLSKRSPLTKC